MSDSDGINASDYLLFSTRNTFMQHPYSMYTTLTWDSCDWYKEDGFVCYVIFREHTNITFLCYDQDDTDVKHTELTSKFSFVRGRNSDWISDQGNEYLTEGTWGLFHVLNEWSEPYIGAYRGESWRNHPLWNQGLDVYGIGHVSNIVGSSRIESGQIWDIDKEFTTYDLYSLMMGRAPTGYFDYYAPIQSQNRLSTEIYHFSLFNSASLTDGEWTQVLVTPEYVWTSVPRFDTQITIGNFFITVTIPQGSRQIDILGGISMKDILKVIAAWMLFGLPGFLFTMTDAMKDIFRSIADAIWDGLKGAWDGASGVPGWIIGMFSKLWEYIRQFGEWVKQALINFIGFVKSLAEELLGFVDFALQYILFVFPFVAFMLVINYYEIFLVKARLAFRNIFIRSKRGSYPDD
jgi:hypothetical protein